MSILNVNQLQPIGGGNTITVSASDVNFSGNISVGSSFIGIVTASTAALATTAILANTATVATNAQGLTGTPDITVNNIQSGVVTATTFIGDGSGITGVTASGSGINIKDSASTVGVAATIDFGTNLNVSPASAGIVTVTVGDTDFSIVDKIVHTGDTNTAIRFPAADTFTVETAGSETARFTSSAITFKAPDGGSRYFFGEMGNSSSSELSLYDSSDAQKVRISSNNASFFNGGNFGIGQDNPQSKLQIENAGEQLRLTYPSIASYIHEVKSNGDYAIDKDGAERLRITSGGSVGIGTTLSPTKVTIGSVSSTAFNRGAVAIKAMATDANCGTSGIYIEESSTDVGQGEGYNITVDADGDLNFHNSGAAAPTVTFADNDNVGIGTDNPSTLMHLLGADTYLTMQSSSASGNAGILFKDSSGTQNGVIFYDFDDDYLKFSTKNDAQALRISSDGHITTPLQPSFNAKLTSHFYPTSGARAIIKPWTEFHDNHSDFNPTTGVFTAPVSGKYFAYCSSMCDRNDNGDFQISIHKNNNNLVYVTTNDMVSNANVTFMQTTINAIIDLSANDTIDFRLYNGTNTASFLYQQAYTHCGAYLIG